MESKKRETRSQEESPNYEMEIQPEKKGKMDISNVVTQILRWRKPTGSGPSPINEENVLEL